MRRPQIIHRQRLAALRVLETQQPRTREVGIVGLDGRFHAIQIQRAVRLVIQRLRLNAAEHRRATAFVLVGMALLADDVLIAALAMRQQAEQVALRAARDEQGRLLPQHLRDHRLELVDGGILPVNIVAHFGVGNDGSHLRGWTGNRIAAQVDRFHGRLQR